MTDEEQKVDIAKLQESLGSLKEALQEVKQLIKELSIENFKRHEESRDSYYIAEMTRKRFEEQSDIIDDKIKAVVLEIDRLRQATTESINELKIEVREELSSRKNRRKTIIHFLAKVVLVLLLGVITGEMVGPVKAIIKLIF